MLPQVLLQPPEGLPARRIAVDAIGRPLDGGPPIAGAMRPLAGSSTSPLQRAPNRGGCHREKLRRRRLVHLPVIWILLALFLLQPPFGIDETVRADTSLEKLGKMRAAFDTRPRTPQPGRASTPTGTMRKISCHRSHRWNWPRLSAPISQTKRTPG